MRLGQRVAVVAGLMAAYSCVFLKLAPRFGHSIIALGAIHVLTSGALFGLRGGLVVALLGFPLNTILFNLTGIPGYSALLAGGGLPGCVAGILCAFAVGRIRDLGHELARQVEERRRIENQKEELVRLIVHDLKNPLAALVPNLEVIGADLKATDEIREIAGDALEATKSMERLVLDMLDVSRSEDGALVPQIGEVDVRSLCVEIETSARLQLRAHDMHLLVDIDGDVKMRADANLVRRVVENLLDNAFKYSPPGSTIRIEVRSRSDHWVELRIRDQGSGIPERYRQRIFDKYVRLDRDARVGARVSRGLGLAFCRIAVEAQGGQIWTEPNQPQGSVFSVRLAAA